MRLCRFNDDRIGVVRDDKVHDVTGAVRLHLAVPAYPLPHGDLLIAQLPVLRPLLEKAADIAPAVLASQVKFRSPVANPSKIIGTPANYHAHAAEAKADKDISTYAQGQDKTIEQQGLFLKACSSLVGPADGVIVKYPDRRTDHEAELGVIIGRTGADIPEERTLDYVAGYAMALDMVIRGPEDRSFRKSLDSFAVLGPWLVTADEFGRPENVNFNLKVNGELRQAANTSEMILSVQRQISWASAYYTLQPGDIIMTGTCAGVGPVKAGDRMEFTFERIGEMIVLVRAAA